jgi:DNA-directed RNA polymerase specialized sigma24 family protein
MRVTFAPLEHRRLAWSFVTMARPEEWLPLIQYVNFEAAGEAAFTVGERHYTVFAHDWRVEPFAAWWDNLCERSLSTEPVGEEPAAPAAPAVLVLSEPEFAASVRQALRDYARPAALAANPLVKSRLVAEVSPGGDAAALQALLRQALEALTRLPKDEKFHRALLYTYFESRLTQEAAAERLGLPFNTYRYHLARGAERIVEWLWARELSGSSGAALTL